LFFSLVEGISNACSDATEFIKSVGEAVKSAADGTGDIAGALFKGMTSALRGVLKILVSVTGASKFIAKFKNARQALIKKIRELVLALVKKLKKPLDKLFGKLRPGDEPITPPVEGKFKSGEEFQVYVSKKGKIIVSWNPNKDTKEIGSVKVAQDVLTAAEQLAQGAQPGAAKATTKVQKGVREVSQTLSGEYVYCIEFEKYLDRKHTIDMTGAPAGSRPNAAGHPRNSEWFWRQMGKQFASLFDEDNLEKLPKRPLVNVTWIAGVSQHAAFVGDFLIHHHLDQGKLASGLPQRFHNDCTATIHTS